MSWTEAASAKAKPNSAPSHGEESPYGMARTSCKQYPEPLVAASRPNARTSASEASAALSSATFAGDRTPSEPSSLSQPSRSKASITPCEVTPLPAGAGCKAANAGSTNGAPRRLKRSSQSSTLAGTMPCGCSPLRALVCGLMLEPYAKFQATSGFAPSARVASRVVIPMNGSKLP
eukprot:CAMPEP_0178412922 /NCGR_PEP_ID=MMETSP0689_2-20121128/22264_1 /TAXON_ID=160604 /ORGANISM="Amphidinium massartii, Strain CS-259" /LENGTH=175 /DNA_ID=CAMNT_0020034183 /DNA_START=525 /DNA_END=1048 /DNA_ORIENTATION=-